MNTTFKNICLIVLITSCSNSNVQEKESNKLSKEPLEIDSMPLRYDDLKKTVDSSALTDTLTITYESIFSQVYPLKLKTNTKDFTKLDLLQLSEAYEKFNKNILKDQQYGTSDIKTITILYTKMDEQFEKLSQNEEKGQEIELKLKISKIKSDINTWIAKQKYEKIK